MPISREHARLNPATVQQLKAVTSAPAFQHCWVRPYRVDYTHTVPETTSYSSDGSVYFIDKDFYAAVRSGQIRIPKMTPNQIIQAALVQDRTEKCLIDSGQDSEPAAHEFARLAEFQFVRKCGSTPKDFEAGIKKIVDFNRTKQNTIPIGATPQSGPAIVPAAPSQAAPTPQPQSPPQPQPAPQASSGTPIPFQAASQQPGEIPQTTAAPAPRADQTIAPEAKPPAQVATVAVEEPKKPPKKKRGKRKIKMKRDEDGNMVAHVYEDGKLKRRMKATRDEDGGITAEEE